MKRYTTYEEPFAGRAFTEKQMHEVYRSMTNKTEYPNFECWLDDMLRSGVFEEESIMDKKEFVKAFESVLRNANVDVVSLELVDNEHIEITFVGGGKRKINIACDSYKAIMVDVLKYCE